MSQLRETIFLGRDNVIRLQLSEDRVLFNKAYPNINPDRWVLTINSELPLVIDSELNPEVFDWGDEESILELNLGQFLTEMMPFTPTTLVLYTVQWPHGLVWFNPTCTPDQLLIRVCNQV